MKIVGVSDDLAKVEQAEKAVQEALGDSASAARSQPYYLDITHPEANKGFAIGYLATRLGMPAEADRHDRRPAQRRADVHASGLSIAMGNASEAVQKQATEVTASSEDEGFATRGRTLHPGRPGD